MNQVWFTAFGNQLIARFSAFEFDVGAGGIKVRVGRNDIARFAHHAEQYSFRRPALVGGDDVLEMGNVAHGLFQSIERSRARVAFIALQHAAPLRRRHRAGAAVGEQINQHVFCPQQKQVAAGFLEFSFTFGFRNFVNRLDAFDAKWLDDSFGGEWHVGSPFRYRTVLLPRNRKRGQMSLAAQSHLINVKRTG